MTPHEQQQLQEDAAVMREIAQLSIQMAKRMTLICAQVNVARFLAYSGIAWTTFYFLSGRQYPWLAILGATSASVALLMMAHAHVVTRLILRKMKVMGAEAVERAERVRRLAQP